MTIPEETRREAYYESREDAPTRRKAIYQRLRDYGPMSVETLMASMGYMDRNSVAPRVSELYKDGLIEPDGDELNRYGRRVARWKVTKRAVKP